MSRSDEPEILRAKEYKLLNRDENYNHEAAEELAEALTEVSTLMKRISVLKELVQENDDLHPFIWTTAEGKSIAIHKLEDDHLTNILGHLFTNGRKISKPLRAEARKRNIEIPETSFDTGVRMLGVGGQTFDNVHHEDIGSPYDLG
jgi:hypothetical protein